MVRNGAARQCVVVSTLAMLAASAAAVAGEPPGTVEPAPTVTGSAGLFRLSTTEVGDTRRLHLALFGELSHASDFLVFGDINTKVAGDVAASLAVHRHVQLFAAVRASWNRSDVNGTPASDPSVSTIGSGGFSVGAKAATAIGRAGAAAVEIGARLPFAAGSWPDSGAAWIDGLASLDLTALTPIPLRLHGSGGFYADGSRNQIDFAGQSAAAREVAQFAHGMGSSRVRIAFGLDAPLERWTGRLGLRPFAEYHYELITADPDPALSDQTPYYTDQVWVTAGLRARAGAGVTLIAGVDVGAASVGFPYGPPLAPWNAFAGASRVLAF